MTPEQKQQVLDQLLNVPTLMDMFAISLATQARQDIVGKTNFEALAHDIYEFAEALAKEGLSRRIGK